MLVTTTGALCPSYEESPVDEAVAPQADAHGGGGLEDVAAHGGQPDEAERGHADPERVESLPGVQFNRPYELWACNWAKFWAKFSTRELQVWIRLKTSNMTWARFWA